MSCKHERYVIKLIAMQSVILTELYNLQCRVNGTKPTVDGGVAYASKIVKNTDRLIDSVEDDG